jgi:hypothetical protein
MKAINAYPRNITPKMWQCREPVAYPREVARATSLLLKKALREKIFIDLCNA